MTAVKLPVGLRDGKLYEINNVAKGKACGCVCPHCGAGLVAKQGLDVAWHFAHESESMASGACGESVLHIYAKKLLIESKGKHIQIPITNLPPARIINGEKEQWIPGCKRRVDVLLSVVLNGTRTRLGVEIAVTNKKDEAYGNDVVGSPFSIIEIAITPQDVAKKLRTTKGADAYSASLKQLLLGQKANKRMLYNRKH